jgi:large repetitive protein
MLRRAAILFVLTAAFAGPAAAQPTELTPGVTYERTVMFTPHGVVVLHVITAPRPGGLYALQPVLAGGTLTGGLERVTRLQRDLSATATVAGINGDYFHVSDGRPSGVWISNGLLGQPPLASRSSIGIDTSGALSVQRERLFGTWQGTGQRRTLNGLNEPPAPGQAVLFTSAYGSRTPAVAGAAEVALGSFPATAPNTDLAGTVTATGSGGGEPIPPGGAVLMASGAAAEKLQSEAPVGSTITTRLGLQPAWDGVTAALGGGPVLVRNGKAVFRSLEDFTNDQVGSRTARAAVGQRADGSILLVTVDGGRPGYSVGLTGFELAQELVGLGAVTAAGLDAGDSVTAAFDGRLLNRPSSQGERAVKEALLVEYFGVYAPEPPVPLLTGEPGLNAEPLSYKVVRQSTVTASVVGPDGTSHPVETAVAHPPGTYAFTAATFDHEGTWRWDVSATDDLGRTSTIERTFRYDTTLQALAVPRAARRTLRVGFTLTRPARVTLRIETSGGVLLRSLPGVALEPGPGSVVWDGRLPRGSLAFAGSYVAHLLVASDVGSSERSLSFRYRR